MKQIPEYEEMKAGDRVRARPVLGGGLGIVIEAYGMRVCVRMDDKRRFRAPTYCFKKEEGTAMKRAAQGEGKN